MLDSYIDSLITIQHNLRQQKKQIIYLVGSLSELSQYIDQELSIYTKNRKSLGQKYACLSTQNPTTNDNKQLDEFIMNAISEHDIVVVGIGFEQLFNYMNSYVLSLQPLFLLGSWNPIMIYFQRLFSSLIQDWIQKITTYTQPKLLCFYFTSTTMSPRIKIVFEYCIQQYKMKQTNNYIIFLPLYQSENYKIAKAIVNLIYRKSKQS